MINEGYKAELGTSQNFNVAERLKKMFGNAIGKAIFIKDFRTGENGKGHLFKKCQVYNILSTLPEHYMAEFNSESICIIPKEHEEKYFYIFQTDKEEDQLRAKILREENEKIVAPPPLTQADNHAIMAPKENNGEVNDVDEKVKCPHCDSEFNKSLLESKGSTDKCLVCGEFFEDSITCPECDTKIKRSVLDKQKDKGICPVCGDRLDGKKVKVSSGWKYSYSKRDIEVIGDVSITCKCGGMPSAPINKFQTLTPELCKLKDGETIKCSESGCKNTLTADFIVLAEKPIAPETHTITCPTCGSSNVKKIKVGSKIMAAGLLDVFAIPYMGKTFECQHCKYTW